MKRFCNRCPVSIDGVCLYPIDGSYDETGKCLICESRELANCGLECKIYFCEGCGSWLFPQSSMKKVNK